MDRENAPSMTHPTLEELFEACLARLRGENPSATVATHLCTPCAACEARLREVERLVHAMISDRAPDPPAAWVERAIALYPKASFAARLEEFGRGLVEETARLVFSSRSSELPAFAGARGASTIRRLRFEAEGLELDLQVERYGRGGLLVGQLLALKEPVAACEGAVLLATSGTSHAAEAVSDALGEFNLSLPDFDELRLRVSTQGRLVVFDIPAPALEE